MDWNARIGRDVRELDGIVAILLSLAGLAERAAGATYAIRCVVFCFLRQADSVATGFVVGSACGTARANWLLARTTVRDPSHPIDAIDLALSLSRLACAVAAMVAQLRRLAFLHRAWLLGGSLDRAPRHVAPRAFGMTALQVEHADTS
jgi:hypothetical protein